MDLKIVKEEIKKNMIERNISTEQLAKILDIKIRSLQTYMSKNGKIPVSILKKMAKNNFFDVKNIVNTEFSNIEKKIKNKKEELEKLDYELYLKKLEYEKLERTSGARSKITWACIDIQKYLSNKIIEIGSIYNLADKTIRLTSANALKQLSIHLKTLATNVDDIVNNNNEINMEGEKMNNYDDPNKKYNIIPQKYNFDMFDEADKTKILTYKVGQIVPRILQDLDLYEGYCSARKVSLLINGKKDKRENYNMKNYIDEYSSYFKNLTNNITIVLTDIFEEIIDDMLSYNKNNNRKQLFFTSLNTIFGQQLFFTIAVISIGEYLLKTTNCIENGQYLELVLRAKKELSKKIKDIFKKMNRNEYTEEEAKTIFKNLIEEKVQEKIKFDLETHNRVRVEEKLFEMCDEKSMNDFIISIVDNAREKVTHNSRLFAMSDVDTTKKMF